MSYWVYIHTCKDNGKKYVGCTTRVKPEIRWGRNGEGYKGQLFGKVIRKHGWYNFTHEVFEVDSAEEMYRKEVELISFFHSNDPRYGYNLSGGGEKGALGCKRSEEYLKKQSKSKKGKPLSEEHKRHIAESKKGKPRSVETRKKLSEAHKGQLKPKVKISLPDGTTVEVSKQNLTRWYINKGKKFEYVD